MHNESYAPIVTQVDLRHLFHSGDDFQKEIMLADVADQFFNHPLAEAAYSAFLGNEDLQKKALLNTAQFLIENKLINTLPGLRTAQSLVVDFLGRI